MVTRASTDERESTDVSETSVRNGATANTAPLSELVRTGSLRGISTGATKRAVELAFGAASESSPLSGSVRIECYAGRKLQLTYQSERLVLIAVYLHFGEGRTVALGGIELVDDLPVSATRQRARFADWLSGFTASVEWEDADLPVRGRNGVSAVFEDNVLVSLQVVGDGT